MHCKRVEPMQLELFDSDDELIDIDTDDDNETYEIATEESPAERSNEQSNRQVEQERPETSEQPRIVGRSEIDDGYELQTIIGATHCDGQMQFLVKWTHSDRLEFVQSNALNLKFPAQVIAFYEQRMRFVADDE